MGARTLVDGQPNIDIKRKVNFFGPNAADGTQAEIRLADGKVFMLAGFAHPSAEQPPMPGGWLQLNGTTTVAYWSSLDNSSFTSLSEEFKGDAWSLMVGKAADHYRLALANSLDSIKQAAGNLEDGSPAQVITAVLKPEALPELLRWVDDNKPLDKKALSAAHSTTLTTQLYIDQAGRPVSIELKIIADVLDLEIGGMLGAPADTKMSIHLDFSSEDQCR